MPAYSSFFARPSFGKNITEMALVGARGCELAYNPDATTNIQNFATALHADSFTIFPATTWMPPAFMVSYNDGTRCLFWAGSTSLSQVYLYLSRSSLLSFTNGGPGEQVLAGASSKCNSWLSGIYPDVASIKTAITQRGAFDPVPRVFIFGHSLGAALGRCLSTDLVINNSANFNFQSLFSYGCPNVCNQYMANILDNTTQNPSFKLRNDPIVGRPLEMTQYLQVAAAGGGNVLMSQQIRMPQVGYKCAIENDGISIGIDNFAVSGRGHALPAIAATAAFQAGIVSDHYITQYAEALERITHRQRNLTTEGQDFIRDIINSIDSVSGDDIWNATEQPAGNGPTNEDLGLGWNSGVLDWGDNTVPSGVMEGPILSQGVGGGRAVVRSAPSYLPPTTSRKVTARGDGHAERAVRKMISDFEELQRHDSAVALGLHRGTVFLNGAPAAPENLQSSIDTLLDYLRRLV